MGNAESSAVLSGIKLNKEQSQVYNDWTMTKGMMVDMPVTAFSSSYPPTSKKKQYMQKALQASRVYRHPGLLRYICGGELPNGDIVVVTEEAVPLQTCQQNLSPLQLTTGLASIIKTLIFLHDTAGVSHNNLCLSSIFVTPDNAWKLWSFEYSCSFSELSHRHLSQIQSYCQQSAVPPDDTARIAPAYQHARDVYAFACLVDDLLVSNPAFGGVPGAAEFVLYLRNEAQHKEWSKRPRIEALERQPLLQHEFLKLHQGLSTLFVKGEHEREAFLSDLVASLRQFPEKVVATSLLPALLSRPVLLVPSATAVILPAVLTPDAAPNTPDCSRAGLFSRQVFEEHVVPHLVELFELHDLPIREVLLQFLPHYLPLLPKDILKEHILPEILLGVQDTNERLVGNTLRALALLVPVLGAGCVVGKRRLPIFAQTQPKSVPVTGRQRRAFPSKPSLPSASALPKKSSGSASETHWQTQVSGGDLAERSSPDGGEDDDLSDAFSSLDEDQPNPAPALPNPIKSPTMQSDAPKKAYSEENPATSSKSLSYKLGREGFNEIFGHMSSAQETTCGSNSVFSNRSPETNKEPAIDTNCGKESIAQTSEAPHPGPEKTDGDCWSDWDDIEDGDDKVDLSSVLDSLNAQKKVLGKVTEEKDIIALTKTDSVSISLRKNSTESIKNSTESVKNSTESVKNSTESVKNSTESVKNSTESIKSLSSKYSRPAVTRKGLGEEFDIHSIQVPKKADSELDLFADLAPNLNQKKFDLERLLEEANSKQNPKMFLSQEKKSQSSSLQEKESDLQLTSFAAKTTSWGDGIEGDGWGDDDSAEGWGDDFNEDEVGPPRVDGLNPIHPPEEPNKSELNSSTGKIFESQSPSNSKSPNELGNCSPSSLGRTEGSETVSL